MATVQNIFGGTNQDPSTSVMNNQALMGGGNMTWAGTDGPREGIIPTSGYLSNFRVGVTTAPGAGKSWTISIRINTSNSALSETIADTATLSALNTSIVAVSAGDRVQLSCTPSGTPTAPGAMHWGCTFHPAISGETILFGCSTVNLTASHYYPLQSAKVGSATEWDHELYLPTPGTWKKLFVRCSSDPSSTNSRTFALRENNVTQGLTCTINSGSTTASDTTNSFTSIATDRLALLHTVSGTPTAGTGSWGVVFVPTTEGQYIVCNTSSDPTNISTTEYAPLCAADNSLSATESEQYNLVTYATTFKHQRIRLEQDPGTVNVDAYSFTLRLNGTTDSALATTVTANNTTGNTTADVSLAAGDKVTTKIVPISSPSVATKNTVCYYGYNAPTPDPKRFRMALLGVGV